MSDSGRRLLTLLIVVGVIGAPAVALRALCAGRACDDNDEAARAAPYCSLPDVVRDLVAAGFYDGRSPDALGVSAREATLQGDTPDRAPWPSVDDATATATVPTAFVGRAVNDGPLPEGNLADVAPTLERAIGIRRPFPAVRSGEALPGVIRDRARSPLVVAIVWKRAGPGSDDAVAGAVAARRASIGDLRIGSLPLDPAAVLTTIGSGGVPAEHGIVGSFLRGEPGVVPAWSPHAPTSVIATLGDDLDSMTGRRAEIGIVADASTDRGLIGGTWNAGRDDDDVVIERGDVVGAVRRLLGEGYGQDAVPDLLGVTLGTSPRRSTVVTREIVDVVLDRVDDATVVVTTTGDDGSRPTMTAEALEAAVESDVGAPVVARVAAGGVFVDADVAAERSIPTQRVVDALVAIRTPTGVPLLADAFPSFAVTFGRYC